MPKEELAEKQNEILKKEKWIIEGFGTFDTIMQRIDAADTIILIDHPLIIIYWRSLKRKIKNIFTKTDDLPEGTSFLRIALLQLKSIWPVHKNVMPRIVAKISKQKDSKLVVHIKSPKELADFKKTLNPEIRKR